VKYAGIGVVVNQEVWSCKQELIVDPTILGTARMRCVLLGMKVCVLLAGCCCIDLAGVCLRNRAACHGQCILGFISTL
jgi:hypothetical protein